MPTTYNPRSVSLSQLLLDPNNYRFQDAGARSEVESTRFHEEKVQESAWKVVRDDGVMDLKSSILSNGFLPVERIVVKLYADGDTPLFVVLEGNRRLAALRWIAADHANGVTAPAEVVAALDDIPVVVVESDDPSVYLSIMGVRHVGGIKEWGGYQSAKLVSELKDDHGLDTQNVASRLGLGPVEVNRRYRAYKAVDQMRNDEEYGDYADPSLYALFFEAISSPKVKEWLKWNDTSAQFDDAEAARVFFSLISPSHDESGAIQEPKISKYLEVRELKSILDNPDALAALLDTEKSFSDASAIAKADAASGSWRGSVKSAMKALDSVGAREMKELTTGDKDSLRQLADSATLIVDTSDKLNTDE